MKALILSLVLIASVQAQAVRQCDPAKSKPCGKGCISLDFTCHQAVTTAIVRTTPKK